MTSNYDVGNDDVCLLLLTRILLQSESVYFIWHLSVQLAFSFVDFLSYIFLVLLPICFAFAPILFCNTALKDYPSW